MTATPSVLALIPHFRCEQWLDHCLTSLVEQSRPPDGIVVIDDASPEPPTAIVRRYRGVTLLRSPRNVGPYRLIQQVIDDTSFDWYLFQDADDWSAPDRLERLLEAAARTGADLLGSDYLMVATDEGLTIPHAFPEDVNAALASAPTCHALQHPTSLVRRRLVERLGGYSSGMRFSGDDEFLRRAAHVAPVVNVPRFLYFRRHRPESLTTSAGTGHGSPARRQVLEALAERARRNAAAAEHGEAPVLAPYATAPPVALDHLCGPELTPRARQRASFGAPGRRIRERLKRATKRSIPPTLIVGGPASGADTLLWALGQHPSLRPVVDVSWLTPLADSLERAEDTTETRHLSLSADRRLRPLDPAGATPEDLRRALDAAVTTVVGGEPADGTGWMALVPPDRAVIARLLRLLPDARVVHVVRDADRTAVLLARRSRAVAEPIPLADAYQAWLDAARAGLACERAVGGQRALRVPFDDLVVRPSDAVARCLGFLGLDVHPACVRFFESLDVNVRLRSDEETPNRAARAARELSAALCGPPLIGVEPAALAPFSHEPEAAPRPSDPVEPEPKTHRPKPGTSPRPATANAAKPDASSPAVVVPHHVARPAALLRGTVPAGSVVAVVTKGDAAFRDVDGAEVWHFPQMPDGEWAGYHPGSTDEIVAHLGDLRRRGARYFLIPDFASWWFDHYTGLRDYLLRTGRLVAEAPEAGSLFELGPEPEPPADHRPTPARAVRPRRRPSVSVVAWNTTHNPLGRAYVLAGLLADRYDVEIVGGRFEQFGTETWPPLADMEIPLRSFPGTAFPDLHRHLEDFAKTVTSDAVVVSKPRLPSFLLGMMAKALGDRPLILDVDDRELTFVGARAPRTLEDLRQRRTDELENPYGRWWTQLCESLVGSADHVTVSNGTLRALFGGTVVPHARDERVFDPSLVDRDAARARFGFGPDDRIVLFGGTPRRHKGVLELAEVLGEIGDDRTRLCLIGTAELDGLRADLGPHAERLRVVPPQPFRAVPALVAAADVVAVLQDPASEVSAYQMPAKITDALAMQVPCLVRRVPPLEPLIAGGHLHAVGDEGLAGALTALLDDLPAARQRAAANRDLFLSDYSFAAVRPRLEGIVESLLEQPPAAPPAHGEVLDFVRERFGAANGQARRRSSRTDRFDVVMFWKQHDTGLYGRRHDMLMRHLASSSRVGQVVQFDAPVDIATLSKPDGDLPTHATLLRQQALARLNGVEAAPGLHQYSFVYANGSSSGESLPDRDEYLLHVKEALARHGVGERPVVFWVYPKHLEFPEIARTFNPDVVVADVIDDHRTWLRPGADPEPILRNYEEIVSSSDVVLVNCEPMREFMTRMVDTVHLVPNAAEYPDPDAGTAFEVPAELRSLQGPVVGYAGNLSSRIDVELLQRLATERPDWNLVLMGSSHAGRAVAALTHRPNVVFLGPRPYDEAKRYIRSFDVGIIPHVDDAMTRAMNPLKAFVYSALGVPVVSTDIRNLGELRPLISVASTHADFIAKVEAALGRGRVPIDAAADAVLRRNSWASRAQTVIPLIDAALARARSRP